MAPVSAALTLLLASCGGGGGGGTAPPPTNNPPPPTFHTTAGIAEKGPLITGSAVTAQELDAALSPTGKQYSYQISSDLGDFTPTSTFTSQYIGVSATGYYFDEVVGAVSAGPITLNGYSDLSADPVMNVNLLTTLAYQRIRTLVVQSGRSFASARAQAEIEVLTALKIPAGGYGAFGTLKLGGNDAGAQILAAISSLFVQGNSSGQVATLIQNFQNDIGTDGTVDNAETLLALETAAENLDVDVVVQNLNQRFASAGVSFQAGDIARWIDENGDGLIGQLAFEVTGADSSTTFTLPAYIATALDGGTLTVSGGTVIVNGTPASGSVTIRTGDVIEIKPGAFDHGLSIVTIAQSGGLQGARVSFLAPLTSIEVTPSGRDILVGGQQTMVATAHFSDGASGDVTSVVRWKSSARDVARLASPGVFDTQALGAVTISAAFGSYTGSADLNVVSSVLEEFTVTPSAVIAGVGIAQRPRAIGSYTNGSSADVSSLVTWTSANPQIATVNAQTGSIVGVALGSTTVEARIDSMVHSFPVDVVASSLSPGSPTLEGRRSHSATLLASGKVLIAGGEFGEWSAETYDPETATWAPAGTLPNRHGGHAAVLLADGRVLIAGGYGGGPHLAFAEIYNPATNQWSAAAPMAHQRKDLGATLLPDGRVLVVGGREDTMEPYTSTEIYDPATNSWSAGPDTAFPHALHTATRLADGRVLVTGGWKYVGPSSGSMDPVNDTAELYDPVSNSWTLLAPMNSKRLAHTATLLPDGRVLVAGGSNGTDLVGAEVYDPVANTWTPTAEMLDARMMHAATLLSDGRVMVSGGRIGDPTNSVEVYDPATNSWSAFPSLAFGRMFHTATLLDNDAILFVGGAQDSTTSADKSVEIYW
jgi:N-acetylneuraminic acid mutarotase